MISIFEESGLEYNLMVNDYYEGDNINLIYKGNNVSYYEGVICVYYEEDILKECERNGFNSIKMSNYIDSDLFLNIKKFLNKGNIIFNFPRATFINVGYFYSNYGIYYSNLPETGFTGNIIAKKSLGNNSFS